MELKRHGLSIGIERSDSEFFLSLKASGKLSHADYQTITPMLDAALSTVKEPRVKALIDGTELEGWEARALWDDFRLGLKHGSEFTKIAIFGNRKWLETAAKIGSWFTAGDVQYFDNETDALAWLMT